MIRTTWELETSISTLQVCTWQVPRLLYVVFICVSTLIGYNIVIQYYITMVISTVETT